MTEKEAIKVLKKNYPKSCKMMDGRLEGGFDDTESEFGQALTLAIDVIKRQIPKRLAKITDEFYRDDFFACPICGDIIVGVSRYSGMHCKPKFCEYCGQALDWAIEK